MSKEKDGLIRMRKLLSRRHINTANKIKSLSNRLIQYNMQADREEMIRKEGEKIGLCYALKALDKTCQTEMKL
jgi:hypothetical protein